MISCHHVPRTVRMRYNHVRRSVEERDGRVVEVHRLDVARLLVVGAHLLLGRRPLVRRRRPDERGHRPRRRVVPRRATRDGVGGQCGCGQWGCVRPVGVDWRHAAARVRAAAPEHAWAVSDAPAAQQRQRWRKPTGAGAGAGAGVVTGSTRAWWRPPRSECRAHTRDRDRARQGRAGSRPRSGKQRCAAWAYAGVGGG